MVKVMAPEVTTYKIIGYAAPELPREDLRSMIFSDWMKSLRYGNDWFELIDTACYYNAYEKLIHHFLDKNECTVRLAVLSDEPDTCLGWSLFEADRLHYIYVKEAFRRMGIGRSVLPAGFIEVTHLTKLGQAMRKSVFPNVIFNPF